MTKQQWQSASEPQTLLAFLQKSGKASDRKFRLFAAACSRRIWDWIDVLGRAAVDMAEKFADGQARPEELRAARLACKGAPGDAAWYAAATNPATAACNAARSAQAGAKAVIGSDAEELAAQAKLVREIFGDPFNLVTVDSSWLTPDVVEFAQTIYNDRAFDRMLALADALHGAGCDHQEILAHCRGSGPHVRGCWVLDLILGRDL